MVASVSQSLGGGGAYNGQQGMAYRQWAADQGGLPMNLQGQASTGGYAQQFLASRAPQTQSSMPTMRNGQYLNPSTNSYPTQSSGSFGGSAPAQGYGAPSAGSPGVQSSGPNPLAAGGGALNFGGVPTNYTSAYGNALNLSQQSYNNILGGYQNLLGQQQQGQAGVQSRYDSLWPQVQQTIAGIDQSQRQALSDTYAWDSGKLTQQMINSGLGNTTAAASAQSMASLNNQKANVALSNQTAQLNAGYQSQLGLAGAGYAGQANSQNTQLGQNALNWMNTVSSPYPNVRDWQNTAQMQGAAAGYKPPTGYNPARAPGYPPVVSPSGSQGGGRPPAQPPGGRGGGGGGRPPANWEEGPGFNRQPPDQPWQDIDPGGWTVTDPGTNPFSIGGGDVAPPNAFSPFDPSSVGTTRISTGGFNPDGSANPYAGVVVPNTAGSGSASPYADMVTPYIGGNGYRPPSGGSNFGSGYGPEPDPMNMHQWTDAQWNQYFDTQQWDQNAYGGQQTMPMPNNGTNWQQQQTMPGGGQDWQQQWDQMAYGSW